MKRIRTLTRARTVAGVVTLLTAAVAGCSTDGQDIQVGASSALSKAAATTGATTMKLAIDTTVTTEGGAATTSKASGVRDGSRSSLTMELPVPGAHLSMNLVTDGKRQFLSYDGMPAGSPLPAGWIELTNAGGATSAVTSSASIDQFLERFRAKGATVKDLGVAERDGAEVHRYSSVVDLSASMQTDQVSNRVMKRLLATMSTTMSKVPTTVEVDAEGRIVRIEQTTKTTSAHVRTVMTLSDFGKPVTIDIPTDATSMTLDEFAGLVYPDDAVDQVDPGTVNPDELMTRDDFIDLITKQEDKVTDELAGCIYDELLATHATTLRPEVLDRSDLPDVHLKALMSASTVCGVSGGG